MNSGSASMRSDASRYVETSMHVQSHAYTGGRLLFQHPPSSVQPSVETLKIDSYDS